MSRNCSQAQRSETPTAKDAVGRLSTKRVRPTSKYTVKSTKSTTVSAGNNQ